eukprot:CAMPEP_0206423072 /NCGR_PEP_ID=MMETSP0324_2-20121206/2474_1 /ASSEMBLY_ACC=CAM_ASM_000836 /TAXON_ID=2866 /ORGANISM="Crypthecodinium cohnii, Strain Seligo" /LENGTH=184 /DNA_ID=CAMNT_0053887585 /DNA_START=20 /DNA_END=571 /DNA_ORIENTATION=-
MATLAGRLRLPSSLYSTSSKFLAFSPATSASASIGLRSFAAKAAGGEPAPASPSSSSSSSSAAPPQDSKKDKAQQGDTDEQASWLADWQVSQSVLDERDANKAKLTSNYEDRKKTAVSLGGPLDRKLYVAGLRNKDGTKREARYGFRGPPTDVDVEKRLREHQSQDERVGRRVCEVPEEVGLSE